MRENRKTAHRSRDGRLGMRSQKSAGLKSAPARVHIEELVLHGFAPGDRYDLGEAVQQELTRLFARQGAPPRLAGRVETDRVDGGSIRLIAGSKPGAIG